MKRAFYQWVVGQLANNVNNYKDGLFLNVDGVEHWLLPVVAYVVTDWPEGQSMSLTKAGATSSKRNCRTCTKPTKLFDITDDGGVGEMRLMKETKKEVQYFARRATGVVEKAEMESCIYMEECGFWRLNLYTDRHGHHAMFPPDFLHTLCHGTADILRDVLLAYGKQYDTLDGKCCGGVCESNVSMSINSHTTSN